VDSAEWESAVAALSRSAQQIEVLGRCLSVVPQLEHWRAHGDEFSGGDAANALDQASGLLAALVDGQARETLDRVTSLLAELPPPWE